MDCCGPALILTGDGRRRVARAGGVWVRDAGSGGGSVIGRRNGLASVGGPVGRVRDRSGQ